MVYCTVNDALRRFGKKEQDLPSGWGLEVLDIQAFVDNNEAIIDDLYNGTFESVTFTDEYMNPPGKDNELITLQRPISSVTSLYRRVGTNNWTQLTDVTPTHDNSQSDGFIVRDSSAGIIKLTSNYEHPGWTYGDDYSGWDDMYRITYDAGYAIAPNWVKELCVNMTQRDIVLVLMHNGSTEAKDVLDSYRSTVKYLTGEIEVGKKRVRRHRRPAVGVL